tara:strand:+ start:456 stop:647 length:192 start_codon:yes stop_codon:yes gene_type:complete
LNSWKYKSNRERKRGSTAGKGVKKSKWELEENISRERDELFIVSYCNTSYYMKLRSDLIRLTI